MRSLLVILAATWRAHAFQLVPLSHQFQQYAPVASGSSSKSRLFSELVPLETGFDTERLKNLVDVPKGDEQRKLRRTVYSHDDWKKHRSQDRFLIYLAASFKSGVYKNLAGEVLVATAIAAFCCLYNVLVIDGWTDLSGVQYAPLSESLPKLIIPMTAFTLTSPALGLLLGT